MEPSACLVGLILESYKEYKVGAMLLEQKIESEKGIHIPHNTIYRVLLRNSLIIENMKKKRQRKWVRFERKHSMSMWQGDWKRILVNGQERWLVVFLDDSSRLITCYGVFENPTTENTLIILQRGFKEYGTSREILTDYGTQLVSSRNREEAEHTFKTFLENYGINHIVARVKHPQTNGKIERFFGEVERRMGQFDSIDAIIHWHNCIKPHMSLDYDEPANVFWYRLPPERILGYAKEWF